MKKMLVLVALFVSLVSGLVAGQRDLQFNRITIPPTELLDYTTLGITVTPLADSTCYMGTAAGCSVTALLVPATTNVAFCTNFTVPNDYRKNGRFYAVAKTAAIDTTAALRADIQVQQLDSLTSTAVTVGTAVTVAAVNGSQWKEIALVNGATLSPGAILAVKVTRTAGTDQVINVKGLVFKYEAWRNIR